MNTGKCNSVEKIKVASCSGGCKSTVSFDPEAPFYKQWCKNCCTPTVFEEIEVDMECELTSVKTRKTVSSNKTIKLKIIKQCVCKACEDEN